MKKQEALSRLTALEGEAKQLRQIIETCDEPICITQRVRSFEDACKILGKSTCVPDFSWCDCDERKHYIAEYKLRIIVKALNEGWIPNWNDSNEKKWIPRFDMSGTFSFFDSYYYWYFTFYCGGSCLCLKEEKLARYAGTEFSYLYMDLLKY